MTTSPLAPETASPPLTTPEHPIALFFDGECCFCNRWVKRIMDADHAHRTRFGTKQGATFQQVASAFPGTRDVNSIVVLLRTREGEERILVRSAAVRTIIDGLPGFKTFNFVLKICPRFLADVGYRLLARSRKFIFGTQNECDVVKPEQRALFLD